MRKLLFLFYFFNVGFFPIQVHAQLSGIKTIPGDYSSIANAISDVNLQGVGVGGVIFTIGAGISYIETIPANGFNLGSLTLNSSVSATNRITFRRDPSALANPQVVACTGGTSSPASLTQDGMWKISGLDYLTLDGIDLTDPNATNPATMEFGFGFFKASATDGCLYNSIINCSISLSRMNNVAGVGIMPAGSKGIIFINATLAAPSTALVPTTFAGTNSYNTIYNNTIKNCNNAICLIGYAASTIGPANDVFNDIGGNSAATGNNLYNFGGVPLSSTLASGIQTTNQWSYNFSYNYISNNNGSGANHSNALFGIKNVGGPGASGTIAHNTVILNLTTTLIQSPVAISSVASTIVGVSNTINASYNVVKDCNWTTTATAGTFAAIQVSGASDIVLNYDTIRNINFSGNLSCNGITGMAANTVTANNNYIDGFNITISPASTGYLYCMNLSSPKNDANYNTIKNAEVRGTIIGMQGGGGIINFSNNSLQNLKSTRNGVFSIYTLSSATTQTFNYNDISNIELNTQLTGSIVVGGIYPFCSSAAAFTMTIIGNSIHNLHSNMGPVYCLNASNTPIVTNNKIYDILTDGTTSAIGFLHGIYISGVYPGSSATVSNNYIGNMYAPNATDAGLGFCVDGINMMYVAPNTQLNVYYNTVFLNASSVGLNFSTTAFVHGADVLATSGFLDLKNNIFINTSTPNGTGITSAFRRSGVGFTNYSPASNNNAFFVGVTPGANNVVFYDGTTTQATLTAFKASASPRESLSVYDLAPFLSYTGSNSNFLHLNSLVPSLVFDAAKPLGTILNDFDSDMRSATAPDIGADEVLNALLPVKLLEFSGKCIEYENYLFWKTASEINNNYFDVERARDGIHFEKIGRVGGNGNSNQVLSYHFTDSNPYAGSNYYRLKQVDFNGDFEYSKLKFLNNSTQKINCNFSTTANDNQYQLQCSSLSNASIKLFTAHGSLLKVIESCNQEVLLVDLNNLPKGLYLLSIISKENNQTFKLISK